MSVPIPQRLVATCQHNPTSQAWLERLPNTITTLAQRWELSLDAPFEGENVTCSWVAPARRADGTSVIFKLGLPHMEAEQECAGLRFWSHSGAVQVYEHDPESGAYVMERCEPGTPLRTLPEPEQDDVLAQVLPRLWQRPPEPHAFRPLSEMLQFWGDETRADEARWPDPGLVREGLQLFETLSRPAPDDVLLATDLHAGNVLRAQREPWLVIDVKPFIGDRHYDITQHLFNCQERLRADPTGLIQRVSDLLHLDAERVRLWTFARAATESRDNWDDLSLAHVLRP